MMARTYGASPVIEIESGFLVSTEHLVVELDVVCYLKCFRWLYGDEIIENNAEVPTTRNAYCSSLV